MWWDVFRRHSLKDFESFLQALDLFLTHLHSLLVADLGVDALCFKLIVVVQGLVQLLLGELQILLQGRDVLTGSVLLVGLMLDLSILDSNILVGLIHESLVVGSCSVLSFLSLSLKSRKVGQDDFQHSEDTARASLLSLIRVQGSCLLHLLLQASGVLKKS